MTSTKELIVWLNTYGKDTSHKLKIIRWIDSRLAYRSNRFRELDGKEKAAENLVTEIRKNSAWKGVEIMIYCGNTDAVKHLQNPKHNVSVSNQSTSIPSFLTSKQ